MAVDWAEIGDYLEDAHQELVNDDSADPEALYELERAIQHYQHARYAAHLEK